MKPVATRHRVTLAALMGTFLIFAGCLLQKLHRSFAEPVVPSAAYSGVGNASAPYSDALGPWLHGSLSYYLHNVPLGYLYRPTVGLFFSSILSATNRVAAIPVAFIGFFMLVLGGLFFVSDRSHRAVLTASLAVLVLDYAELVRPLNPETLMVDFWAMTFGLIALWLIGLGEAGVKPYLPATLVGFLLLGVVACVRGPQFAAGAAVLLYLAIRWLRRRMWLALLLAPSIFVAPLVLDSAIQKKYGILNDGVVTLYCVYAMPAHRWSSEGHEQYLLEAPSNAEVAAKFGSFLLSRKAAALLGERCSRVLLQDAALILARPLWLLFAACLLLRWCWRGNEPPPHGRSRRWVGHLALVLAVGAGGALFLRHDGERAVLLATAVVGLAIFGMITERRWTALLALAYIGSLCLHALFGLVGDERVMATYEVFLFAAIVAASLEPAGAPPRLGLR